jgi:predicted aldo/keto reductase-like oxidoreductase
MVAMRFVLDCPQVAAAIVGMRDPSHATEAARVFDLSLGAEDQQALRTCLVHAEDPSGPVYGLERIKDGRHATVMKTNLNQQ